MEALAKCRVLLRCKRTTQFTFHASGLRVKFGNNNSTYVIPSRGFHASTALSYPGLVSGEGNSSAKKTAADQRSNDIRILKELSQYLWPDSQKQPNATALKARVVASVSLLVVSKLVNIQVPFLFKALVDSFDLTTVSVIGTTGTPVDTMILASPLAIVLGYGIARSVAAAAAELRSAIFATVAHDAIRQVSRNVFVHLHNLDMQFHLERNTGALARAIDRGSRSINFALSAMLFHVVPTAFEVSLVSGILAYQLGPAYALVAVTTIVSYTAFTVSVSNWRTEIRKKMNQGDYPSS